MNKIRAGVMYDFVKLIIFLVVAIISASSLCKRNSDNYLEPTNVSNNSGRSENPSIAVDSRGAVHLVWNDETPGNEEIFYATKSVNGIWTTPVQVTSNIGASRSPCIVIDRNDKIHLVWQQRVTQGSSGYWVIFYTWRSSSGDTWAIPETVTVSGSSLCPTLAVDNDLGLHLLWMEGFSPYQCLFYYAYKPYGDTWFIHYLFTTEICGYEMKTDQNKGVHIVLDPHSETYYIEKKSNGTWTDTMRLSYTPMDWLGSNFPSLAVDNLGISHVIWAEGDTSLRGFVYIKSSPQDSWSAPISPYKNHFNWQLAEAKICIGRNGKIYITWLDARAGIGYGVKDGDVWKEPRRIVKNGAGQRPTMAISGQNDIHFAWQKLDTLSIDNEEIYYIEFNP